MNSKLHILDQIDQAGEKFSVDSREDIPKQYIPKCIRVFLMLVFLPFIHLDLLMQKVARMIIRPPFVPAGACKKRGNCCQYILMPNPKEIFGFLHYFWNTQVCGFYPKSKQIHEINGKKKIVLGCRHLSKDGRCTNYRLRPVVCRKWPQIAIFGYPNMLKGCGFQAKNRKTNEILPIEE